MYYHPQQPSNSGNSILTIGIFSILSIGGYLFYTNWKKGKSEEESKKLVEDEPTRQAAAIKNYLGSWYQIPNVTELVNIARQIKDWPAVVAAYSKLYNSSIEEDVRSSLQKFGGYNDFIAALQKKGLPGTNTDNLTVKSKETGLKKGDTILLDDSKYDVVYYKDYKDYPVKKLATVPKGKVDPKKRAVKFVQALEANYSGTGVNTSLYQVTLANGMNVWINRDRNVLKKATVKGLDNIV